MKRYVVAEVVSSLYNAGVVRLDNESFLQSEGFVPLRFRYYRDGSFFIKLLRIFNAAWLAFSVKQNSQVVFHFPYHAKAYQLLQQLFHWRGVHTIAIIIDIDGLRDRDAALLRKEMQQLAMYSTIIAHNEAMKNELLKYLPGADICCIGLFDYPFKGEIKQRTLSSSICFAGSAAKASFIYKVDELKGISFKVYGAGYHAASSFEYKGLHDPGILPALLEGSFGLVWEGDSIDDCDDYLRYNNPHKVSLYLAAGLPVIVWNKSALAVMVEQEAIGFAVGSLKEVGERISMISEQEYSALVKRAREFGKRLSEGYYLKTVMAGNLNK